MRRMLGCWAVNPRFERRRNAKLERNFMCYWAWMASSMKEFFVAEPFCGGAGEDNRLATRLFFHGFFEKFDVLFERDGFCFVDLGEDEGEADLGFDEPLDELVVDFLRVAGVGE